MNKVADYKKMYFALFDEVAKTIDNLTAALQKAEDIYIESDDAAIEIATIKDTEK